MLSGSITVSCLVRGIPYMHISFYRFFFFAVPSFVRAHVLRYATHVALWPFLLEILSSGPAGNVRSGTQGYSILYLSASPSYFVAVTLATVQSRLQLHSGYRNPTRVRSAGQLKNNRSSSGRPYAASILVSASLFLFFRVPTTSPAGTCGIRSEERYKSRCW